MPQTAQQVVGQKGVRGFIRMRVAVVIYGSNSPAECSVRWTASEQVAAERPFFAGRDRERARQTRFRLCAESSVHNNLAWRRSSATSPRAQLIIIQRGRDIVYDGIATQRRRTR